VGGQIWDKFAPVPELAHPLVRPHFAPPLDLPRQCPDPYPIGRHLSGFPRRWHHLVPFIEAREGVSAMESHRLLITLVELVIRFFG